MSSNFEQNGAASRARWNIRSPFATLVLLAMLAWGHLVPGAKAQFFFGPTNDFFTNAFVLTGSFGVTNGDSTFATREVGEPFHFYQNQRQGGASVWFKWTAPTSGYVTFSTGGSLFDTLLAVYQGTNLATLLPRVVNDDNNGDLTSAVTFLAFAGIQYYIAVDGYNSFVPPTGNIFSFADQGPYVLSWNQGNAVVNVTNAFQFSATNYSVGEGLPGFATITVLFPGGYPDYASVDYFTTDGSALAGTDYYTQSNTLVFAPGETFQTFTVPIQDNSYPGTNLSFFLSLANPTNGSIGPVSNSVVTIIDDETNPGTNAVGEFNFSASVYTVTENETFPAAVGNVGPLYIPRDPLGAIITVTRTTNTTGRVLIDAIVTTPTNTFFGGGFGVFFGGLPAKPGVDFISVTNTLVFDDYQMSASFLVPVFSDAISNGNKIVSLQLVNPRPAPEELTNATSPASLVPALGPLSQASIQILEINHQPLTINLERAVSRVDEYGGTIVVELIRTPGPGLPNNDTVGIRLVNVYGYLLQAGSDYTDQNTLFFPNTPYTDGATAITNPADYSGPLSTTVTFAGGNGRTRATFNIINDGTVEFNEDIFVEIFAIPSVTLERIGINSTATITILYDDQPAGAADREWDPELISSTQPPFNTSPGANNTVQAVAVQADGRTVLVGDFTAVNSVPRHGVARMNPDGSLDLSFNPGSGADAPVLTLGIYPANSVSVTNRGKIMIGGYFTSINNVSRPGIARLNINGSLDSTFAPGNGFDGVVRSISIQNDGKVLIAGDFTHFNDVPASGIMRLNQDGSRDNSFTPGSAADGAAIRAVAVRDTAAAIVVARDAAGTDFEDVNVVETGSGQGTVTIDYDFLSIPDNIRVYYEGVRIFDLTTNGVGRLVIPYGPGTSTSFTIIMNEGTGLPGTVWLYKASVVPVIGARTIYVGGDFTSYNGVTRNGVARLLDDGTLDTTFDPGLGVDGPVYALGVQPDNRLLVGGSFDMFHTSERHNFVRLLSDGTLDPNYNIGSGTDNAIYSIVIQPDNKALIGGIFSSYNGTRRVGLARVFTGGSLDTSFLDTAYNQFAGVIKTFSFDPPRFINSIALQADGNIMIGGSFSNLGGNFSISHPLFDPLGNALSGLDPTTRGGSIYSPFTRADKATRFNIARLIGGYTPGPGNLELDPSALPFTIDENAGIFYATMRRVDGRLGTSQVVATNLPNTATSPGDFTTVGTDIAWPEFFYVAPISVGYVGLNYFPVPINDDSFIEGNETLGLAATLPYGSITLGGELVPLGTALGHLDTSPLTIADNDFAHGEFNFNVAVYMTNENAGMALITVIRTNGTSGAASVDYLARPGTVTPATTNADFTPVRGTLSFASGQSIRTFTVPIVNDELVEFDETVSLILTNGTGGAKLPGGLPSSVARATLVIIDNDFAAGRINFASDNFTNNENETFATIAVTRTGGNVGAMSVQVRTTNGTAISPADYQSVTNTLNWSDGDSSVKYVIIPLVNDGQVEGPETVRLILFNPLINGALGARTNATLTINDADNFGQISFSQPYYEVDENGSSPIITVNRSSGIAGTVTVTYATSPLTASPGGDYNDVSNTLIFLPGEMSKTFVVPIIDDAVPDGDKTVQLTLLNIVNGSYGVRTNATLTIIDNESFNIPAGSLDTTFSASAQANAAVYALALQPDGRVIMAGDFTLVNNVPRNHIARIKASGSLDNNFDIGPGANGSIRALALQPDGKLVIGGLFSVINSTNRNGIARLSTDGSLDAYFNPGAGADNPVYALAIQGDDKIVVGGSFATFNGVVRPGVVRLNTNGSVDLSFNAGAGVDGVVYAIGLQSDGKILIGGEFVSINGTRRTNFARLNVNGSLDPNFNPGLSLDASVHAVIVQPDGTIVIGGSFTNVNGMQHRNLARLDATGQLDPAFLVGQSGADGTVLAIRQQIDGKLIVAGDFRRFNDVTRNGITRLRTDGTTDPAINFGNGANAFVAALLLQPDRRIVLGGGFTQYDDQPRQHLARVYGGSIDGAGSLEFSAPVFTVSEGAGVATIAVRRRGGTFGQVSVDYATQDGTALANVDYLSVSNTLTFPPGETRQTFTVPIIPNTIPDGDRSVLLGLGNFVNATAGPQPVSTLIIQDDESFLSFSAADYSVNENAVSGNATITVVRSGVTNNTVTVTVATVPGGTATAGLDYIATNQTLTFVPGELAKLFNVHVINDTNIEGNESILLALSNPSVGTTLAISNATLSLVDDDFSIGQFYFLTNNFVVDEGAGVVVVSVLRTNGFTGIASVRLTTSNLTATAGADYAPTNRVLTFADGEILKTIAISIINDSVVEADETFLLTLSEPTGGATILTTNSTVTIADNEIAPSYVIFQTNNFFVNEAAGNATISVVRTNSRRGFLRVDFATGNGTALAGLDYVATNGTLFFNDGEDTKTFTVPIINDTLGEGNETVNLTLSNLIGTNTTLAQSAATLTIVDDDTELHFATSSYTVSENGGSAVITVARGGVTNVAVSVVALTTPGGTAVGGLDYTPVAVTLNWAAGDNASKIFTVPIIDNTSLNPAKTVFLILSNALGTAARVGSPSNAVLTITDDETANPVAGVVDPTFNGNYGANATVRALAFDAQQRLYVGGDFTRLYGVTMNRVARLATNGAVDLTFDPGAGADAPVFALGRATNGLFVGGAFTNIIGLARPGIARLNLDGSADATFNTGTGANGAVLALASLAGDQVMVVGQFTTINGASAPRVARLSGNGLLDNAFNVGSGPNDAVRAVAVQTNGQIIIAGDFTTVNGFLLTRLARLNADGVVDTSFGNGLGADGPVRGLDIQQDGKILVVGDFHTINGSPRNGVARLNPDGAVDFTFDPGTGANGIVRAVVVPPDNKPILAGDFTSMAGRPAGGFTRLNPDGSVDITFATGAGANAPVHALALANVTSTFVIPRVANGTDLEDRLVVDTGANSGVLIIDYDFLSIPDNLRVYFDGVRVFDITTNGARQVSIPYGPGNSTVVTVVMNEGIGQPGTAWFYTLTIVTGARLDNRIGLGGEFTKINNEPFGRVAVVESTGLPSTGFDVRNIAARSVAALGINTNTTLPALVGRLMVGGDFTTIVGVNAQNYVARLNIDGTLDRTFRSGLGFNAPVRAVAVQPDGRTIVGGLFTSYDFVGRAYVARLNADGSVDNTFNFANNGANLDNPVYAIALQPDGRAVIGGAFTTVYGVPRNSLARLHTNGTVDVTFNPGNGADGAVNAVTLQPDGKVLVGGEFTSINGVARAHIARLNSNGTLDATFNPGSGADGAVNAIALTSTGDVLISGAFITVNGQPAARLARLSSAGVLDGSFNVGSGANDSVSSLAVQADGRIVVGGDFTLFNGQIRHRLARLNADGSFDPSINFGTGANDFIAAISLQSYDGKIVIGGGFTEFDGLTRVAVARLFAGTNSGAGTFQFGATDYTVNENASNAVISVRRTGGLAGAASVHYSMANGTATSPANYTASSGTLNFANAESVKEIVVPITDNLVTNVDRTFTVSLSSPSAGASLAAPSNTVVTILDNDSVIGFSAVSYLVNENAGLARITVVRAGGATDFVAADFLTGDTGTATPGLDFTPTTAQLVFAPGVRVLTVDVPIVDDTLNEFNETVPLGLINISGPAVAGQTNATLTIVENDFSAGTNAFSTNSYFASEDGVYLVAAVTRVNGHSGAITVGYRTIAGGTATANIDYVATNTTLTIGNGATNAFINIRLLDDANTEGNETFLLQLLNPTGGATLGLANATATIVDNDAPGTFVFSAPTYSVSESNGSATITIIRTNGNLGAVSVTAQTTGGTATPTLDYTPVSNVLTFAAGQTVRTITIPILNDALIEGSETVGLLLSNPTGATSIGVPGSATLVIVDDELAVGFASANFNVTESLTNVVITVTRTGDTNRAFTVTANTSDGTATAGNDYLAVTTTLTFAPGETNKSFNVTVLDDTLAEGDEFLNLTLSSPSSGVVLGPIPTARLNIIDNDTTYSFSSATYATNESAGLIVITVIRSGFIGATSTVDFATSDGTATAATFDYFATSGTLSFGVGQSNATFTISIFDDLLVENNETVNLSLLNPSAGTFLGAQSTAVFTIIDNDTTVGFSQTNYIVNEKATSAVVTIVRLGAASQPVTVTFRTSNGSALAGADYTAVSNNLAWASDDVSPRTVTIPILDDAIAEGSETVNLLLLNPVGATLDPANGSAVLTIVDDAGVIAFASSSCSAVEGASNAVINLVRTGGSNGTVSVQWSVTGGSATVGQDFAGTTGVVVFAPGETNKPILFPLLDDAVVEGVETVNLALSNAGGGARVGSPATAVLSIIDNDTGIIVGAGAAITAETITNNVIDPGETVTVLLALRNAGLVDANNVTASLVYANGVTNGSAQTQNYGALIAGGNSAARPFTFTALGTNGTRITATLLVTNNGVFLGPVAFDFVLGSQTIPFLNANVITINDNAAASPYPSTITVSGVSGPVNKLTVTLRNLSHTEPDDLDILLVGPNGAAVMLMSDAGGSPTINNVTITFDDAAAAIIPDASLITNGTYRCANYFPFGDRIDPFASGTQWTNTSLATFNGINPNGVWSLYIVDDALGDVGSLAGGWSLSIATADTVVAGADLSVAVTDSPDPVTFGGTVTYTIAVTNYGPSSATAVVLTNLLPVDASFLNVTPAGGNTLNGNVLVSSLGTLALNAGTVVTVTMTAPSTPGLLTIDSTVASAVADANPANNHVSIKTSVIDPGAVPLIFAARKNNQMVLSWSGTATNVVLQSAATFSGWIPSTNAPVYSNGFTTVTVPLSTGTKFFRLKRVP